MADRKRIETYLTPAEREIIGEWCDGALIPLDRWPAQPELRGFVDVSVRRLMKMMRRTGLAGSDTRALDLAAGRFGLNPDAIRRRWGRRRAALLAKPATECPPRPREGG